MLVREIHIQRISHLAAHEPLANRAIHIRLHVEPRPITPRVFPAQHHVSARYWILRVRRPHSTRRYASVEISEHRHRILRPRLPIRAKARPFHMPVVIVVSIGMPLRTTHKVLRIRAPIHLPDRSAHSHRASEVLHIAAAHLHQRALRVLRFLGDDVDYPIHRIGA